MEQREEDKWGHLILTMASVLRDHLGDGAGHHLDGAHRRLASAQMISDALAAFPGDGLQDNAAEKGGDPETDRAIAAARKLRQTAVGFYREAVREAIARGFGHEGSEFLEQASALRHALIDVGVMPSQLDAGLSRMPRAGKAAP